VYHEEFLKILKDQGREKKKKEFGRIKKIERKKGGVSDGKARASL